MPSYKGEYAPDDQRDVTLGKSNVPGEPAKTGPREGETRVEEHGNAKGTPDGAMEVDGSPKSTSDTDNRNDDVARAEKAASDKVILGETSDAPDERARADANPPLGGG